MDSIVSRDRAPFLAYFILAPFNVSLFTKSYEPTADRLIYTVGGQFFLAPDETTIFIALHSTGMTLTLCEHLHTLNRVHPIGHSCINTAPCC